SRRAYAPAARLAFAGKACAYRWRTSRGGPFRLWIVFLPQRAGTDRAWKRSLLLSAQNGEPSRGAHLERRLSVGAERAGHSVRDYSRHGLDRDNSGRLRDGRNSIRITRSFVRAQLWPLGLHLLVY